MRVEEYDDNTHAPNPPANIKWSPIYLPLYYLYPTQIAAQQHLYQTNPGIQTYNDSQTPPDQEICNLPADIINKELTGAEARSGTHTLFGF